MTAMWCSTLFQVATGGSAICAINVLLEKGADINNMYFFNVVSCPEGLQRLQTTFPGLTIIMGALDERLDDKVTVCSVM